MLVQSAIVAKALGSKTIGDSDGVVMVEFSSGVNEDHYSAGSVNDALVTLGAITQTTPSSAPGC